MKRAMLFLAALVLVAALPVWALGGVDLKGKEIIIGNYWADYDVVNGSTQWAGGRPPTEVDADTLAYRRRIMQEQGFTMREKMVADWGQMLQEATRSIMAGNPAAHVFVLEPGWAMTLYRRGLIAPLSDSKQFAPLRNSTVVVGKQVAYNQDVQNLFTFGGKTYATAVGYGNSMHSAGIFFNKRLFQEAGIDPNTPYDMQRDGTWTWNAFFDLCKRLTRDTRNRGQIDTYALPMDLSTEILDQIAFSNGAEYIGKNAQGRFFNATNSPEFLEAVQFARRLKDEGVMMPRPENANWDWYFPAFHDGRVAMMMDQEYKVNELDKMKDDWGYVLFPKGPKAKDYIFPQDENVMVIPSTYKPDEVDQILYALNLWYMPVSDDWRAGLYRLFRDTRAVNETMARVRNPGYQKFRNHIMIPGLNRGDIAWEVWWYDGDAAQLIESVSQSWNSLVNDANNIK